MSQEELKNQFVVWQSFLDQTIGFAAFGLALGSASLPNPFLSVIASILSLVIINSIIERNKDKFPRLYDEARRNPSKTKRDIGLIIFAKYEHLHYKKYPIYMIGMLSLAGVFIGSLIHIPFYLCDKHHSTCAAYNNALKSLVSLAGTG